MTPEEHRDAARHNKDRDTEVAIYHATMGVLEALLQFDICDHGMRGFCKDCARLERIRDERKD